MVKRAPRAGVQRALQQHQLVLFYQPIHELKSRTIVAAEALLRARRRTGEIRNASAISAGAERGPDLFRLDSWTLHHAFADAARWRRNGAPAVHLNVNLSPREFEQPGLTRRVRKIASSLEGVNLELTETSSFTHPRQTLHTLEALKDLGAELWLDDFGTGHSSISRLLHFPLDGLKVPGIFVRGLTSNRRCRAIVGSIISLAHDLGLRVIAEEVENAAQLRFLRQAKCDYVQGFLFSRPMPVEALEETLSANG